MTTPAPIAAEIVRITPFNRAGRAAIQAAAERSGIPIATAVEIALAYGIQALNGIADSVASLRANKRPELVALQDAVNRRIREVWKP